MPTPGARPAGNGSIPRTAGRAGRYKSAMSDDSRPGPATTPPAGPATVPRQIVVAGDWHGNEAWALSVIRRLPALLAGPAPRVLLHLGDFGIWPDAAGQAYLAHVSAALETAGAELWFLDGNHEDFPQLAGLAASETTPDGRVLVRPRLYYLPRGHRWAWHGRTWLACGGAVSLDRAGRTAGTDWWPEEEITDAQEAAVIAGGRADVLASHDCPSGVPHTFGRPPSWWDPADLARSDAHRRRLQRITDAVQPRWVLHGHLHRAYQRICDFGYGPVQVTGLDADDRLRNFAVLDVEAMTWQLRWGRFRRLPGRTAVRWPARRGSKAAPPRVRCATSPRGFPACG
jgi:Calcineurin-like phosphoesterase